MHNISCNSSGRIIVDWKQETMSVNILDCRDQLIHLEVKPNISAPFFCTFVYDATNKHSRLEMLLHLEKLPRHGPWIVLGDFNCLTNLNERVE